MKTMNKTKTFDCVKMKNDIQAKIYAETRNMTTAELLAYYNRPTENNDVPSQDQKQSAEIRVQSAK
jgi:hypothetical protein